MSSKTAKPKLHSAAWRISFWATLAFAFGTMIVFVFLHRFIEDDIQQRSDAWLAGEVEVLGDVAERTPKDALYGRVVGEVAELAGKEVPNKLRSESASNDSVFFLQTGNTGAIQLWVGAGSDTETLRAIQESNMLPDVRQMCASRDFPYPFEWRPFKSTTEAASIWACLSETNCAC